MTLWMVRAGRYGEQEGGALDNNVVTIGWDAMSDLSKYETREELTEYYNEVYPDEGKKTVANGVGQIWRFSKEMQKGDLVALPLKTQSAIAIGEIKGKYEYKKITDNIKHIVPVKWLKTIPRSAFDQDLLYSLGAFMTVCQISRNDAENRVRKMLEKGEITIEVTGEEEVVEGAIDIEQYSRDQIEKFIARKFKGHELPRLVDAVLKAQGYVTKVSPEGPDGGIDILASGGALGFDPPRICVQVKSSASPVDVKVLRELQGVMSKTRADQGLLVSWGGFNSNTIKEARDAYFSIRLWDSGDLIRAIFKHYNNFEDELKAELPLKRIWGLVLEEE